VISFCLLLVFFFSLANYASISDSLRQLSFTSGLKKSSPASDHAHAQTIEDVFSSPPQDAINFKLSASEVIDRTADTISQAQKELDAIAGVRSPNFANVLQRLAFIDALVLESTSLSFLQSVSPKKDVRDASSKSEQDIAEWSTIAGMRKDVYQQVLRVHAETHSGDEEDSRLLSQMLRDYRRRGLLLNDTQRDQLAHIDNYMTKTQLAFENALAQNSDALWFTDDELAGVPRDLVESWPSENGKRKMTFAYPDYVPVMSYCSNAATRKAAYRGYLSRCPNNTALLIEMLALRQNQSDLLGFATIADFILDERMAKNSESVMSFLTNLTAVVKPARDSDLQRLAAAKTAMGHEEPLYAWDTAYLNTQIMEREYHVDAEMVSEYFELGKTMRGMLNICEKLFDLHFVQINETDTLWHDDVQQFAVWRTDTLEFVGYLYFDLHPRDDKYGHAASFLLSPGYERQDGSRKYPSNAIVCNFSKAKGGKPSLLKHGEVKTLFHELGHGIHALVSRTKYARFHMNPSQDFIEIPSLFLQYWSWSPKVLSKLSSHFETGEPMPDELLQALISTRLVFSGYTNARQIGLSAFDMHIHTAPQPFSEDQLTTWYNEMLTAADGVPRRDPGTGEAYTPGQASFGHIMSSYAAGYYSYLFSQTYAADMYYGGFDERPLDPILGRRFRDEILVPGGARDEEVMLERFLGRKPSNAAFMAELSGHLWND
jgi:Zn-dependent oligopeptidase